jgi:hypothetical protein
MEVLKDEHLQSSHVMGLPYSRVIKVHPCEPEENTRAGWPGSGVQRVMGCSTRNLQYLCAAVVTLRNPTCAVCHFSPAACQWPRSFGVLCSIWRGCAYVETQQDWLVAVSDCEVCLVPLRSRSPVRKLPCPRASVAQLRLCVLSWVLHTSTALLGLLLMRKSS